MRKRNNRDLLILFLIIALCVLIIDIVLSLLANMYVFSLLLFVIFIVFLVWLILFISKFHNQKKKTESVISNIEDTIILKLEDLNSCKISPIRNKKELELKDDISIKEDLKIQRENKVTKEKLEEELSKTVFINDLKERIRLFELEQDKIKQKEEAIELKELNKLIKNRKSD